MSSNTERIAEIKNILIDLVKQHPLIYDKSHPLHFQSNASTEVWDKISKILAIPGKLYNIPFICEHFWSNFVHF